MDLSSVFTGPMKLLYQGSADVPSVRTSQAFVDQNIFVRRFIPMKSKEITLRAGVKNIFNTYQNDLDVGLDRDADYVYSPIAPRSIYFSIKIH